MISTGESAAELDRMESLLRAVAAAYRNAVRSTAQYAIEIDSLDAQLFRQHIEALEEQLGAAVAPQHWEALQTSFRGELRAYRDKATGQLGRMRADIEAAAVAMLTFADSVASNGLDHQQQLQEELGQLRSAMEHENLSQARAVMKSAAGAITASVAKMQRNHQLVIAQLRDEMRLLISRSIPSAALSIPTAPPASGTARNSIPKLTIAWKMISRSACYWSGSAILNSWKAAIPAP